MARPQPAKFHFGGDALYASRHDAEANGRRDWQSLPAGEEVGYLRDTSVSLVKEIDGDWLVAYRLIAQGGSLVVGELRIYPNEGQLEPGTGAAAGEWSGTLRGLAATVPLGGLTARTYHKVTLGTDISRALPAFLARMARESPPLYAHYRQQGLPATTSRIGRRGTSVHQIARVAATYARHVASGSHEPIQQTARTLRLKPKAVTHMISVARQELHFLTPTRKGRSGGLLTPEGERALHRGQKAS